VFSKRAAVRERRASLCMFGGQCRQNYRPGEFSHGLLDFRTSLFVVLDRESRLTNLVASDRPDLGAMVSKRLYLNGKG
jgi:hypothetical protein